MNNLEKVFRLFSRTRFFGKKKIRKKRVKYFSQKTFKKIVKNRNPIKIPKNPKL